MNPFQTMGIGQTSSNNNDGKTVTRKCKPVILSKRKREEILRTYCKIIRDQTGFIAETFQKSFQKYSEQLFEHFDKDKFMEFIHDNIFEYLDTIFKGSNHSQFALLHELKDVIVDCMYNAKNVTSGSDLLTRFKEYLSKKINDTIPVEINDTIPVEINDTIPVEDITQNLEGGGTTPFMHPKLIQNIKDKAIKQLKDMSGYTGLQKIFNKELQEQNKELQQQNQQLQQQNQQLQQQYQYPQYQEEIPQAQPIYPEVQVDKDISNDTSTVFNPTQLESNQNVPTTNTNALSTDGEKLLGDLVTFSKDTDYETLNKKIQEIVIKRMYVVIKENKDKLYKPIADAIKPKIDELVSNINTSNNNIKMSLLLHMLNENFTVIMPIINRLIVFVEQPSNNLKGLIEKELIEKELIEKELNRLIIDESKKLNKSKGGKRRGQAKTKNQATTHKNKRKTMRKKRNTRSR
jgi:hypothetical protein